jgi:UDP-3-O-[3-hydroxymyristoyl] glucosamine N-acyltransferase
MELEKFLYVRDVADGLRVIGKDRYFNKFSPILEADEYSIVWSKNLDFLTEAKVIVCKEPRDYIDKTFIISENPRYTYLKIVEKYASLVGITCDYKLGDNPYIHPNVVIYDNVTIGDNVVIHPNCVIGSEGFGFELYEGKLHKFPHIGRVLIGNDVEIQALTNVDRGTLGDTVIGDGTKIDTHCHIGHNTKIGKNCTICAMTQTGGGTIIGDNVYIAPNVAILTRNIKIGDGAFVGTGALVVKNVKPGERVMGHPAKPF